MRTGLSPELDAGSGRPASRGERAAEGGAIGSADGHAGRIWVNVASSTNALDGFINLDNSIYLLAAKYRPLSWLVPRRNRPVFERMRAVTGNFDILRFDCRKPLPFAWNSVEHILCSHFLEHVHPDEAERILSDYVCKLKPGGTLHVIVPDLEDQVRAYWTSRESDPGAADRLMDAMLLTRPARGSLRYRLLEFAGGFGLQHRWMYDRRSMARRLRAAGFELMDTNETPSRDFRRGDGSVHLVARKPAVGAADHATGARTLAGAVAR